MEYIGVVSSNYYHTVEWLRNTFPGGKMNTQKGCYELEKSTFVIVTASMNHTAIHSYELQAVLISPQYRTYDILEIVKSRMK